MNGSLMNRVYFYSKEITEIDIYERRKHTLFKIRHTYGQIDTAKCHKDNAVDFMCELRAKYVEFYH